MRLIIVIAVVLANTCGFCYGYVRGVNDEYYERVVEPKLDVLGSIVKQKATEIIRGREPVYEIELTQEERYFSLESMEFYTGKAGLPARYSGVKRLAVWRHGLTSISGWTYDGENYHVNYVYTRDARFEPVAGIHAFGNTSELEKYFHGSLYDISARDGAIESIPMFFSHDYWAGVWVLISYSGGKVQSIMVRDDNVYDDKVPVVPNTIRMNNYVNDEKLRIDWEAEHGLDLTLQEIRAQKGLSSSTETEGQDTNLVLRIAGIVTLSLSIGAVLSFLSVVVYKKLGTLPSTRILVNTSVPRKEKTSSPSTEEDYIDVEYVEVSKLKDTE
ncbi:MAG: hypothetical protein IJS39_11030 [Synergistaceae bacterium]|nr:hypothetical protein [Synergistaceae bacterium]